MLTFICTAKTKHEESSWNLKRKGFDTKCTYSLNFREKGGDSIVQLEKVSPEDAEKFLVEGEYVIGLMAPKQSQKVA